METQPPETSLEDIRHHLEEQARLLALNLRLHSLAARLTVVWNTRLRTTAGRAFYRRTRIELNPRLLSISWEEVDRTLRHELAHLVVRERFPRKRLPAHGTEWKKACRDLGINGEKRCHNLPFERTRMTRKFFYRCPACGKEVGRVKRITQDVACYDCCQQYNGGQYAARYRLEERRLDV